MEKIVYAILGSLLIQFIGALALGKYLVTKLVTKDEVIVIVQESEKGLVKLIHDNQTDIAVLRQRGA